MRKTILILLLLVSSVFAQKYTLTTTIASGQTTTPAIQLSSYTLAGVQFPSSMTGTSLTIYTSNDTASASFKQVMYEGSAVTISVTADKYNQIQPSKVYGLLRYIKLVSSSTEASSRTLVLFLRPL